MTASPSALLVALLSLFVLVGHVCELPAVAAVLADFHDAAHHEHADGHHGDATQVSCDAVVGIQTNACASADRALDAHAGPAPVVGHAAPSVVAAAPPDSRAILRRPPLFLLHASLLI